MKRWLVDGRFYVYAATSAEAVARVAAHLGIETSAITVERAGTYVRIGNQIVGGPEGRDA